MKYYNYIFIGLLAFGVGISVGRILGECRGLETSANSPSVSISAPVVDLPEPEIKSEPEPAPAYELTVSERELVERVVMAEAGGEPYEGQQAVAQCILNACVLRDLRPAEVIKKLKYTGARPAPTASVKSAVEAVFDEGVKVLDPDAIYFYAPALASSSWHESQVYVDTIGCHRFFKEAR